MISTPIFITGNQNKADKLAKILGVEIEHQKVELDEIQSADIREVAAHKAKQAYEVIGRPVLIEDTGLCLTALGGLPGPFVKFFVEKDDGVENMCRMLDGFDDRSARAVAVFAYYDGVQMKLIEGGVDGVIVDHPRGDNGWDWDKIFAPSGYEGKTQAEQTSKDYETVYGKIKPFRALKDFLQNE